MTPEGQVGHGGKPGYPSPAKAPGATPRLRGGMSVQGERVRLSHPLPRLAHQKATITEENKNLFIKKSKMGRFSLNLLMSKPTAKPQLQRSIKGLT